ncbi:helix-turn-helix transcriptional regulator [Cryptosporangium phraense]|uniref:Helix-turn-helix transcriptional regulator n=1 Tax=Cryptosporangium phraense TaxID=2593070 RepID=A0A545AXN4_9ACTN|nr:helix-turn-helix transcriptional regulator [Cryptosporangium phraense]TQS46084.1 helix-turn-helix transcriptional regulator [Cryptosporangium phraense]
MREATAPRTTDLEFTTADAIEQFLVDSYDTPIRIRSTGDFPTFRHRRTDVGTFAVETGRHSADLQFDVEPLNVFVVCRTSTARLARTTDGADDRYDAGALFLMNDPDRPHTSRWFPGELQTCVLDPALLGLVAASAPDRRAAPIRFTALEPLSPGAASHWQATRSYVAGLLENPDAASAPLVVGSAARLLAAATLATFPNTAFTDPDAVDRHDAHPDALRRAVAFIEDHPQDDVAIADIAAAAHVSVRAVQLAFRRHLAMTPTEYLRRVRLSRAHEALRAADPTTTTVAAVACRWGFPSPGRFAALYRRTYRVTPGQTLRGG